MNASESLYARLAGNAGVAALVGARIYPVSIPQVPTMPCISYSLRSEPTAHCMTETASTIKRANYTIQCWDVDWDGAIELAEAVEAAIDADYMNNWGGAGGVRAAVTLTNQLDLGDDVTQWKRRILEFEVWYTP